VTVGISICKRCGRFIAAELARQHGDLADVPWFLTEAHCVRCHSARRMGAFLRVPLPALIGLMAFGGFGLVLSWI